MRRRMFAWLAGGPDSRPVLFGGGLLALAAVAYTDVARRLLYALSQEPSARMAGLDVLAYRIGLYLPPLALLVGISWGLRRRRAAGGVQRWPMALVGAGLGAALGMAVVTIGVLAYFAFFLVLVASWDPA